MSFDDQDIQPAETNAEVPAQSAGPEAEVQAAPSEMPMVAQAELVPAPEGIQVADASGEAEWLFDALEEEAAEEEEEAYEESDGQEASVEEDTQVEADADASGEASAEATVEAGGAEAAGGAAASSGGISSAWIWGGLAVAGAAAAAGGGGSTTKTPEPPTVTLDTDSGIAGDGITSAATFTVGGLENNTSWEYSTDGGSTWTAGSGSSFEVAADGDYTVVVRQTRGQKVSENSASIDVTLDASAPAIGSSDTANIDENADADSVVYTASVEDATDVTFSLKEGSDAALSIDSASGAVTLAGSPDHETQSSYAFTVVATDAAGNASEQAVTLTVNDLDEIPPEVQSVAGDSTTDTVTLTFNEALSNDPLPDASTFTVSQAGNPIAVNSVAVSGTSVVLTLGGDLVAGPVQVVYTPGTGNNVTDVAGNESAGFTQLVVSDGYIRGASIYLDANNDGIAQAGELIEGATTDAKGQVILPDDIEAGTLLIVGGVNMDTGAINKIVIKTKVGNTAANPLTTLVETVKASGGLTDEEAEQVVATGLGITLQAGQSLSTYDPIADTTPEGLAARKAVATVATILASAANTAADTATSDAVVSSVATNIAAQLVAAASQPAPSAVTFDEATITAVLKDSSGAAVGDAAVVQNVTTSVQTIKDAVSVDVIVETQAKATDTVAPDAPDVEVAATSDSGESNSGGVTNDATPTITVSFETDATDGTAVVVGNLVEVLVGDTVVGSGTVSEADLVAGSIDIDGGTFNEGDTSVVARVTDKAGNVSELSTVITVSVDTQGPQISSDGIASIDENDGSDVEVYTAAAADSNTIAYSLADGASTDLSINSESGVVTLAGADFESQDSYVFTVVATDVAGNKSERAVTLSINNVDEVAPTITSGATAQAIDENSGAGQVIYTAVADDTADISGGVTFSLADGSDAGVTVNAQTGEVTLTGNPDHETQSSYTFTVVAKDAAGLETEQEVTLDINDLDESAPTITSGATAAALDENSAADSVVYTATSTDDGDISTGATTYSLGEGSDQAITINAQTGEVTLTGVADFEQKESYSFVVDATDAAGNKSTQTVTLAINNLDEVAPVITSGDQIAAIDENTASGQVIYTATATDLGDVSDGVTFSLADGTDEALSIDAETGVVTLNESPDFETASSYEFTVVATDGAGNKVDKTLTLAINDLDEGPPVFTSAATASVNENVEAGSAVYTAAATDGSPITFSLAEADASNFTIDAQTGVVSVVGSPNYEDQTEYTFTVTATDAVDNADSLEVTLSVNNLDEAAPIITSGATATAIDENSGADQVVYTATATDDGDVSGGVLYSLAEDSDQALSINAETGAVTLSTNPDHETQSAYNFTVIAKDAAGNSSEQAVNLTINDLDEADPVITSADAGVAVDENSAVGTVIYTAVATDDGDVSGGVSFSLSADSAAGVEIDAVSGEVSLTA
ncbi:MAG: cadherin domain-containing protein, partial [Halieaceae bacterium]|nr:cadherin domain-containing protein [Halieaceae bacterium]